MHTNSGRKASNEWFRCFVDQFVYSRNDHLLAAFVSMVSMVSKPAPVTARSLTIHFQPYVRFSRNKFDFEYRVFKQILCENVVICFWEDLTDQKRLHYCTEHRADQRCPEEGIPQLHSLQSDLAQISYQTAINEFTLIFQQLDSPGSDPSTIFAVTVITIATPPPPPVPQCSSPSSRVKILKLCPNDMVF